MLETGGWRHAFPKTLTAAAERCNQTGSSEFTAGSRRRVPVAIAKRAFIFAVPLVLLVAAALFIILNWALTRFAGYLEGRSRARQSGRVVHLEELDVNDPTPGVPRPR